MMALIAFIAIFSIFSNGVLSQQILRGGFVFGKQLTPQTQNAKISLSTASGPSATEEVRSSAESTLSPTPTQVFNEFASNPTSAPTADPNLCFAGSETIAMESGETKLISEVAVGDRVLAFSTKTNSAVFSEVVSVPYAANNVDATFAEIVTANSNVKMTPAHLLPAGTCGALSLMQAGEVKVGDCISTVSGEQVVTGVNKVQEKGIYTIVANEEYVIVSGVVASPFAVNHFAANMFYNIHRALYNFAPYAMKSAFLAISNGIARQAAGVYSFM